APIKAFMDFDGDGKSDQAVYRDGVWWILRSLIAGGIGVVWGGLPQDIPVPGDYDGDGKTDRSSSVPRRRVVDLAIMRWRWDRNRMGRRTTGYAARIIEYGRAD